jgi:FHA domain
VTDLASALRALANQLSREQFLERTRGRYLIVSASTNNANLAFHTAIASQANLVRAAAEALQRRVLELHKSDRSPFSNISVGRTRNCDVVLREPSVSKLHAHFLVRDGAWQLVDRGSANGTMLNGKKLAANKPSPVKAGDEIVLGAVTCVFADAPVLYRELGPG